MKLSRDWPKDLEESKDGNYECLRVVKSRTVYTLQNKKLKAISLLLSFIQIISFSNKCQLFFKKITLIKDFH